MSAPAAGGPTTVDAPPRTRRAGRAFYVVAAVVCLLIAGVGSLLASSQPDGLERVAADNGFANSAQDSATAQSPLADYQVGAADSAPRPLSTAAAGIVGVSLTAALAFGVFALVSRGSPRAIAGNTDEAATAHSPNTGATSPGT